MSEKTIEAVARAIAKADGCKFDGLKAYGDYTAHALSAVSAASKAKTYESMARAAIEAYEAAMKGGDAFDSRG